MTANVNFTLCGRSLVFTSVPFLLSRPNDSDIYNFVITHLLDTKLLYAAVVGCDGNHGFIIARVFIFTLLSLSFPFWIMNTDYILPGVIEDNIRPSTPSSLISVWCIWAPRVVNGRPQTKKKKMKCNSLRQKLPNNLMRKVTAIYSFGIEQPYTEETRAPQQNKENTQFVFPQRNHDVLFKSDLASFGGHTI